MRLVRSTEGGLRLGIGVVLNVLLLLQSGMEPVGYHAVIYVAASVSAVVTMIPIFWRGEPWQAAVAIALLLLPVMAIAVIVETIRS
jgi:hypothetical protein